MKKILYPVIFFLLVSAPALTATEEGAGTDNSRETRQPKEEAAPKEEHRVRPPAAVDTVWPRTFVPSEKINADTVVSFPADI